MADDKPVTTSVTDIARVDSGLEFVFGVLNQLRGKVQVVRSVKVKVRYDVSKISHNVLAISATGAVGWPHVSGVFAENVTDSHLVLDHLVVDLLLGNGGEILMGPGVGSDLVTIVVHPLDDASPVLVDSSLSNVVTSKEEGGVPAPGLELLHDALCVDVRTIVVSDSDRAGVAACIDTSTTVGDASKLGTGVVTSACSTRSLVLINSK
jgi:hypothetical protein